MSNVIFQKLKMIIKWRQLFSTSQKSRRKLIYVHNLCSATFFSECDTCEAKAYHDALLFGIELYKVSTIYGSHARWKGPSFLTKQQENPKQAQGLWATQQPKLVSESTKSLNTASQPMQLTISRTPKAQKRPAS